MVHLKIGKKGPPKKITAAQKAKRRAATAKWSAKNKAETARREAKKLAENTALAKKYPLPAGIKVADLQFPKRHYVESFEMRYIERFGWVIPTLHIANGGRHGGGSRTYAISVKGTPCRVGNGPHVLAIVTVYVSDANKKRLETYLNLRHDGQAKAGETRDRISSRRLLTQMRRTAGW